MKEAKTIAKINPTVKTDSFCKFTETGAKERETVEERVVRLYQTKGGPFVGWLLDEAKTRGQTCSEMACEIGVSCTYIEQLRSGACSSVDIKQATAEKCGKYLGVPPVVVKLAAGGIRLSDFVYAHETEEEMLDRVMRKVQDDRSEERRVGKECW